LFESFINRENKIFEVLQEFINSNLTFIVIGGYAVSAFKHRFSVDADVVIKRNDKNEFEEILKKKRFIKTIIKELDHVYSSEFIRYETREKLPVSIDLLIDGVGSRTTNVSFGIKDLEKYSKQRKIKGIEKEVTVLIPEKEILVVLKIHSGRLTDFRDIAALSKNLNENLVKELIWRGKKEIVKNNIKKLLILINKKEFIDSFKGVFAEKKYDLDLESLKRLKHLL